VEALEGDAGVVESEVARVGGLRDPGEVGCGEGEDGVHHKRMGCSDREEPSCVSLDPRKELDMTDLGIMSVHSVILDVLFLNISLVMEERWWTRRRSVFV
jgi:hypothetical protein